MRLLLLALANFVESNAPPVTIVSRKIAFSSIETHSHLQLVISSSLALILTSIPDSQEVIQNYSKFSTLNIIYLLYQVTAQNTITRLRGLALLYLIIYMIIQNSKWCHTRYQVLILSPSNHRFGILHY